MSERIVLHVNGQEQSLDLPAGTSLLHALRNELGLRGVKAACESGRCGACAVLIDRVVRPSCRALASYVQNREVVTIEGLSTPDSLHPIQQAFIDEGAVQCGYCTPGLVLSSVALLERKPCPTAAEVREALAWHVCRCGVHERAVRAVLRASGQSLDPLFRVQIEPSLTKPARALPSPLKDHPSVDSWIRIEADETVTVFTGKVEFGQGIPTAIAGIAAEELDVSIDRIRVAPVDTDHSPDEGYTVSSISLETSGNAVRYAAAHAQSLLLAAAAESWGITPDCVLVDDGVLRHPDTGRRTTYWELMGGRRFDTDVPRSTVPKASGACSYVGRPMKRLDLVAKVTGTHRYVHDLSWPDILHARVVRPPSQRHRLVSADDSVVERMPGRPTVVRDGAFLAVAAANESHAVEAARALGEACVWEEDLGRRADPDAYAEALFGQRGKEMLLVEGKATKDPIPPVASPQDAALTLRAEYFRPFQRHASLSPSAAAALADGDRLTVWTHAQSVFPLRAALAHALEVAEDSIRVIHAEGAGCFGHNGADDAALDAAIVAKALPGRHVLLKWTTEQEAAWEPAGTAMGMRLQASIDANGRVIDWNHDVWSHAHWGRSQGAKSASGLIATWHRERPLRRPDARASWNRHGGGHRNADPLYTFPKRRIVKHFIGEAPIRVGNLRSLGAFANVFAVESFVDELAHAARIDPVAFRLMHLEDERARVVVEKVASEAGWTDRRRASEDGRGHGLAFAQYKNLQSYVGISVELTCDEATGGIHLEKAIVVADAGRVVNPDGLSAQLEGGFLQGASWTLFEEAPLERGAPPEYKVLGFPNAPEIRVVLLSRPDSPILGCGEAAPLATGAAIANALFDAVGTRLRHLPFSTERVLDALRLAS